MPLSVLVAIVVVGIALTVLAVHFTGGSEVARLADADEAVRRFLIDFPAEKIDSVHLTADKGTAFLPLHGKGFGVVHAVGGNFLTRVIMRANVASLSLEEGNILSLRLRDFTWKGGEFSFADPRSAAEIASLFKPAPSGAEKLV
jgi:hypothetical protein